MNRYTAILAESADPDREPLEEIDVDARNRAEAEEKAEKILREEHVGGLEIIEIVGPRHGYYL